MSRSTCTQCGAPRRLHDQECPYCQCVYEDVIERQADQDSSSETPLADQGIIFETEAAKRWALWSHPDCRLRITRDKLIFDDPHDATLSFTIPLSELQKAKIDQPRGWLGIDSDVLIILENGEEYEFGLEDGVKQKMLKVLDTLWDKK